MTTLSIIIVAVFCLGYFFIAIENVNGLIRQYIPKNTCFSNISQQQITKIMQKINTRPREKLNFSTPNECFYKKML